MVRLIFYTRQNCHLCDVAKLTVCRLQRFINFDIEERYVDDNPDWVRLYGDEVPVGIIGCRKVFKYRVDVDKLTRAIEATPNNNFRNGA